MGSPEGAEMRRIFAGIDNLLSDRNILNKNDLRRILSDARSTDMVPATWSLDQFTEEIVGAGHLVQVVLKSPDYAPITRLARPGYSPLELGLSLRPSSYLSHGTALTIHGLSDASPSPVYVNAEQSEKPPPRGGLSQSSIDRAFRVPQRVSRLVYSIRKTTFVLLAGKYSDDEGVEDQLFDDARIRVTSVTRTLIDATVRPNYCGGVTTVAEAFARAKGRTSGLDLLRTLDVLDYVYPYHQLLGFYLERSGYPSDDIAAVAQRERTYVFYAEHGATDEFRLDEKWLIRYPPELDR